MCGHSQEVRVIRSMDSLMVIDFDTTYKFFKKEIMEYILENKIPKIVENTINNSLKRKVKEIFV